MIVTIRQAHERVAELMHDTFSKDCEYQAKTYMNYLSNKGIENSFIRKNHKDIRLIASNLCKITNSDEMKAYTDSLPVETKSALLERFTLFLGELKNFKSKKIEMPYSRNLMLQLILIDYSSGSSAMVVKHRYF